MALYLQFDGEFWFGGFTPIYIAVLYIVVKDSPFSKGMCKPQNKA